LNQKKDLKKFLKRVDKAQAIVTYCSVGYRSSIMARQMQKMGYTNVRNLEGSIFAWVNEGRDVFSEGQVVFEVHPFNEYWGQYLDEQFHPKE